MEVVAAIIGVALSVAIAIFSRNYKSTISYQIKQSNENFLIRDNKISFTGEGEIGKEITLEQIYLKNVSFFDIEDVVLHVERTPNQAYSKTLEVLSISKATVTLTQQKDFLEISIANMPKGEEITVQSGWVGSYGPSVFRKIRGTGKKYRTKKLSEIESFRNGVSWVFGFGFVAPAVIVAMFSFALRIFWKN